MRRFATDIAPVLALVVILLASISLMSGATEDSARFGEMYSVLLLVNAAGLIVLAGLITWNLIRLIGQVRRREAGARLTVRMAMVFVALSLAPVLVLYYFSLQTLHRGIDSWFDVRIEDALNDALELGQTSLGTRMREQLRLTEAISFDLSDIGDDSLAVPLAEALADSSASELTIIDQRGSILASSSTDPTKLVPTPIDDSLLLQVRQSQTYVGLDPVADTGLHVRAIAALSDSSATANVRYLHALFPVDERLGELAQSIESAYDHYSELTYLREPLKFSFTLTLTLALALSMFAAAWIAFFSARRLVAPLQNLARATNAVAEGNYEPTLQGSSDDELGFLVDSFNDMTLRLRTARDDTRRSQAQEQEQRAYLEAVLTRMSSGVVTVDDGGVVVRANLAATQILALGNIELAGRSLSDLTNDAEHLRPFSEAVDARLGATDTDWQAEVNLFGPSGRQVLVCRGTVLPGANDEPAGHVVVFDDLTALIEAQRNAAWSEVARRLAHEIKNPLTPIQLSAERLRHKCLPLLSDESAAMMDRLTRTIVNQVESMKEMVNAFSAYARSPHAEPVSLALNDIVADVSALYGARVTPTLADDIPNIEVDPGRLRQLLHNLIKNAQEAVGEDGDPVLVTTRYLVAETVVELEVRDHGPGIADDLLGTLFEPYVTAKPRGTGLGLAIVKKIAEESSGAVIARNHPEGGASVTLRLPARPVMSDDIATLPEHASAPPREPAA
jgi:nitrogen fixation/metabolism regulation signal transduction histidine kinase